VYTEIRAADWLYQKSDNAPRRKISVNGTLSSDLADRYTVDGSSLVINDVNVNDAGIYVCGHGSQLYHKLQLNVDGL